MKKKAVYAGSFDPITNGHLWLINRGAMLFDELVVAIGTNPDKQYTFTVEERLQMLRESVEQQDHVSINHFHNQMLVNYATSVGARFILRGIRSERDYEYERGMRHVNADLCPEICTVFLIPPRENAEVRSSFVKGLIGPEGWEEIIKQYVPDPVHRLILAKYSHGSAG